MEDEVYEVEKKVEKPGVVFEYYHPAFWKRVSIIVFDALIWALICLGLFIGCRAIVQNTQTYKDNERENQESFYMTPNKKDMLILFLFTIQAMLLLVWSALV